jgi:drug/metabolite transporter (DMT)-like permease
MSPATPENPGILNLVLVLTLSVIWGAAFLSVRVALDGFGPWQVAALRTVIAAGVLFGASMVFGQGPQTIKGGRAWAYMIGIGTVSIATPFMLLSWGQQFIPSAFAGVAMGAVPLLVLPLVAVFSPEEGIGVFLGFVGLLILLGPKALQFQTAGLAFWGQVACIGAAGCYALGSVATRRAPKVPPIAMAFTTMAIAALVLVPLALWQEGWPTEWPPRATSGLLYAALGPTALAAVIRIRIITTAGSMFMSITSYLVPVWSVIFGVILLSEDLPARLFVALAVILAGIGLSQSRALQAAWARRFG